eukprot:SAG11_NODE_31626_length_290_cov_1.062827_2_plen_45_part_01
MIGSASACVVRWLRGLQLYGASVNHSKHEVDAQSKTVIRNAMGML